MLSASDVSKQRNENQNASDHCKKGDENLSQKNYEKAIEEYEKAHKMCYTSCQKESYKEKMETAKNSWAEDLNSQGLERFNQGHFLYAAEKFKSAFEVSNNQDHKDSWKHAEAEIINDKGDKLVHDKKFNEAISKFGEAFEICPIKKTEFREKFQNNKASVLHQQGLELLFEQKFVDAAKKFLYAFEICSENFSEMDSMKQNLIKAENEVKAQELFQSGMKCFEHQNFVEALETFKEATNTTTDETNREKLKNHQALAHRESF